MTKQWQLIQYQFYNKIADAYLIQGVPELFAQNLGYCSLGQKKPKTLWKAGSISFRLLSVCLYVFFSKRFITPKRFELQRWDFAQMFILLGPTFVQIYTKISLIISKWRPFKIFDAKLHEDRWLKNKYCKIHQS